MFVTGCLTVVFCSQDLIIDFDCDVTLVRLIGLTGFCFVLQLSEVIDRMSSFGVHSNLSGRQRQHHLDGRFICGNLSVTATNSDGFCAVYLCQFLDRGSVCIFHCQCVDSHMLLVMCWISSVFELFCHDCVVFYCFLLFSH